jgi:hypothetical protein
LSTKKINSKQKGARYEREVVNLLKEQGIEAHRSQQFCGYENGDGDVEIDDPRFKWLHVECKHVERANVYDFLEQAKRDCEKNGKCPTVWHRKNGKRTMVILDYEDFFNILHGNIDKYRGE